MKIDVEGSELDVLHGAESLLRTYHPTILAECSDILLGDFGATCKDLVEYLRGFGYSVAPAGTDRLVEGNLLAVWRGHS